MKKQRQYKKEEKEFAQHCDHERKKRTDYYKLVISQSRDDARDEFPNARKLSFIKSCEDFLNKTGHLTEKQIEALQRKWMPTRGEHRSSSWYDGEDMFCYADDGPYRDFFDDDERDPIMNTIASDF